eukprot:Hpha_TRINITY_DN15283_c3_g5::TRINITY_DN15283_c3_g5_i1::g.68206::m.68206
MFGRVALYPQPPPPPPQPPPPPPPPQPPPASQFQAAGQGQVAGEQSQTVQQGSASQEQQQQQQPVQIAPVSHLSQQQAQQPWTDWLACVLYAIEGNAKGAFQMLSVIRQHPTLKLLSGPVGGAWWRSAAEFSAAVELLLSREKPALLLAMRQGSVPVNFVVARWLRQCFLGYLDWPEVVNVMMLPVLFGADYFVYLCYCCVVHLGPLLMHRNLRPQMLACAPICSGANAFTGAPFRAVRYLGVMQGLRAAHGEDIRVMLSLESDLVQG